MFAPGSTTKAAPSSCDPFGDDIPAVRVETHGRETLAKLVAGDFDDDDEGSFRKSRRENYKPGDRIRWLKARKTFCITKAVYTCKGLWLISGSKDDGSGDLTGIFHPSELAVLAA